MIRFLLFAIFLYELYCCPLLFHDDIIDTNSNCVYYSDFKEGDSCTVCHIVIDAIAYDIRKYNKTIHDITELTKDLCKEIGGEIISQECNFIIDNIQKIIDWIQDGSSVNFICTKLNLC